MMLWYRDWSHRNWAFLRPPDRVAGLAGLLPRGAFENGWRVLGWGDGLRWAVGRAGAFGRLGDRRCGIDGSSIIDVFGLGYLTY